MTKESKFWNSDKLFGLSAMLVSLVTLIIFVKQTTIMDRQSRLSALPYLMIEQSIDTENQRIKFTLVNHGVGPAIVESRKITYEGRDYNQDFYLFLTKSVPELDSIEPYNWSSVYRGQAIPSNGRLTMIAIGNNKDEFSAFDGFLKKLQANQSFDYEILYSSIYGEKWKISNKSEIPEKLH